MKNIIYAIAFITLTILSVSCNQQEETVKPQTVENLAKSNTKSILNARSSTDIPSKFYGVNQKYKRSYKHIRQGRDECSWTSYVMTTGAIANGNGRYYPVSASQVAKVKSGSGSSYISDIERYSRNYDSYLVTADVEAHSKNSSGRFEMVKDMLYHIDTKRTPFVALGSTTGGRRIGHYYIVWSIDWKRGGTGSTVYYTDPLDYPQSNMDRQVKAMNFTTFLNLMRDNPDARYYNCLFLW